MVIVKLLSKRIMHNYLKTKLVKLWKLTDPLTMIYLRCDYYIENFDKSKNMTKTLHRGPW